MHDILLNIDVPLKQLVRDIEGVLGVQFDNDWDPWAVSDDYGCGLMSGGYTGYEDYGYSLEVGADDDQELHARAIFEQLKVLNAPMVLMAEDLQIELERFDPPAA